jgi:polyisoprenoid-binding protein YceI
MKKQLMATVFLLAGLSNFLPVLASAVELDVDPAHSNVGFDIKHLVVSTVHGNFSDFNGLIDLDEKNPALSKVNFTVKIDSISTNNAKRDAHLKSADFFDAQKYPEAKFVSTGLKSKGKDSYILTGDLTIHGVTKKAELKLIFLGKVKDPYGVERRMFQASTEIVRKDYGLTYNATLESGGVVIGENAKLTIDVESTPKVEKPVTSQ